MIIGTRTCIRSDAIDPVVTVHDWPRKKSPIASADTPSTPRTPEMAPSTIRLSMIGSDSLHTIS